MVHIADVAVEFFVRQSARWHVLCHQITAPRHAAAGDRGAGGGRSGARACAISNSNAAVMYFCCAAVAKWMSKCRKASSVIRQVYAGICAKKPVLNEARRRLPSGITPGDYGDMRGAALHGKPSTRSVRATVNSNDKFVPMVLTVFSS